MRNVSAREVAEKWEKGWDVLFGVLAELGDEHLAAGVTMRGVVFRVDEALLRSLAHAAYHVGQIVLLARAFRGDDWEYLSIPPCGSEAYNANPVREKSSMYVEKEQIRDSHRRTCPAHPRRWGGATLLRPHAHRKLHPGSFLPLRGREIRKGGDGQYGRVQELVPRTPRDPLLLHHTLSVHQEVDDGQAFDGGFWDSSREAMPQGIKDLVPVQQARGERSRQGAGQLPVGEFRIGKDGVDHDDAPLFLETDPP